MGESSFSHSPDPYTPSSPVQYFPYILRESSIYMKNTPQSFINYCIQLKTQDFCIMQSQL